MAQLKKVLSYKAILLITINSIMGTGIFFLPAVGAKSAGPASIVSWLLLSFISIYVAMFFGELVSMFPKAGGIYEYCKQAYGRFTSFLIGWMTILAGNITIAMLVVGAIQYLTPASAPLTKVFLSLIFVVAFNYIAFRGMQTSATMLVTFAFITLATILGLAIPGIFKLQVGNFSPFFVFPMSSILLTIFLIAETFFGWETATFLAEETKDGEKVMPKALIWGTVIIAIICLVFVITSMGVIPWKTFGASATPLSDLGILHYGVIGGDVFAILVYLAIIGSVAGWVVSAPRLLLAMAQDKLFLTQFGEIHTKNGTPHKAIMFQAILTTILVFVGAGSYTTMLHLLVPIVLIAYAMVLLSVVVLRYKKPNLKRHYTVPFGKSGPIVVALIMILLIGMWLTHTENAWEILRIILSLLFLGIPLYFLIEMYYDAPVILKVNQFLSKPLSWGEHVLFPFSYHRRIPQLVQIKNKVVLEFGSALGTLTHRMRHAKKIIAVDYVKHNSQIHQKRFNKQNHIESKHSSSLTSFSIKVQKVDTLISTGILSYLQKPQKVISDLAKNVRKNGEVLFIDYDKFFHLIPNVAWIRDEQKLKKMFSKAGFNVTVRKKRGFLWTYIIIKGRKR